MMMHRLIAAAGAVSLLATSAPAYAMSLGDLNIETSSSTSASASLKMDRSALKEETKAAIHGLRVHARQTRDQLKNTIRAGRRGAKVDLKINADVDAPCVKSEVTQREQALMAAFTTYADSLKAAMTKRQTSLEAAWSLSVAADREAALKLSWEVYVKDTMDAHKIYKEAKKTAWKSFQSDVKANCKASVDVDANAQAGDLD